MSREWDHYDLTCVACGNKGAIGIWSDDWNRWGAEWVGFTGKTYVTGPAADLISCEQCGAKSPAIARRQEEGM